MREAVPASAELEIDYEGTPAGYLAADALPLELAAAVFERVWGAPALRARLGGTLPIFPALADRGIPCVLTGIALPESNVHSPNERLLLELVPLGYRAARDLFVSFAELK
jgi:acetylornithine deacetylase/succinyl-diaminopimelate desuccinylase-like protein